MGFDETDVVFAVRFSCEAIAESKSVSEEMVRRSSLKRG